MKTLKNVLLINAISSGATGVALVIFASTIAKLFEIAAYQVLWGVGIFLFSFAVMVFLESKRHPHNLNQVRLIIALDVMWVVGSLVIILLQLFNLSVLGYSAIGAVAMWVAAMAYLQINGVKQITPARQ
jgi:hypothetical protein